MESPLSTAFNNPLAEKVVLSTWKVPKLGELRGSYSSIEKNTKYGNEFHPVRSGSAVGSTTGTYQRY